jgi:DNA-binding transcriptional MocR family regulator
MLGLPGAECPPEAYHGNEDDDYRNYGGLWGLPEARALMAGIMDVPAENVMVLGNSSLSLMYDAITRAITVGVLGAEPWAAFSARTGRPAKFLCPVPGYDRHFSICEYFGIKMLNVPMTTTGPDMDAAEAMVADPDVKGIWCVPKYANPTGIVYSDATVRRLAALRPAAPDFRIYWDNAYAVHDLVFLEEKCNNDGKDGKLGASHSTGPDSAAGSAGVPLYNIKLACEQAGNDDMWYQFCSTSKVTFAGAGIAAFAASKANLAQAEQQLGFKTIGPDKLNQLRHVLFLRDPAGLRAHMRRHAAIIAPKFACVHQILQAELGALGIGTWTQPTGGYFISFTGLDGTARRTVELAAAAGVVLTGAGATYPYGIDPNDANIRIAPTYPGIEELRQATTLFALCACIAALEVL